MSWASNGLSSILGLADPTQKVIQGEASRNICAGCQWGGGQGVDLLMTASSSCSTPGVLGLF